VLRLLTVGHGTSESEAFLALLSGASVELITDVRRYPGSRRNPQHARDALESALGEAGIGYRWEEALGGRRSVLPDSPNVALRNAAFRGYADHMATAAFQEALGRLLEEAARRVTAVMCAESLWWRCHRRLIADAAALLHGVEVVHLGHDGRLSPHPPTDGVRRAGDRLVYDVGETSPLL
jgi:uncharacterized protein (DUF488 family)